MKIQLKRSNVLTGGFAKEPTAQQLEYGELAVNYNTDDPAIFLKDSNNNVIRISGVGNIADDGQVELPASNTPPLNPQPGNLWYNSEDGRLYIYYEDPDTEQWVDASPDSWDPSSYPDVSDDDAQAGTLDDRYLMLNADNSPVTGNLALNQDLTVGGSAEFTGNVTTTNGGVFVNRAVTGDDASMLFAADANTGTKFSVTRQGTYIGDNITGAFQNANIQLLNNGSAEFAGRVDVKGGVTVDGGSSISTGFYYRDDTEENGLALYSQGSSQSNRKVFIKTDGSASFSGNVQLGGNPLDSGGPGTGTLLRTANGVTAAAPSGTLLWNGKLTGTAGPTSSIYSDGNATFADVVQGGAFHIADSKFTSDSDELVRILKGGNRRFVVRQDGSATFAGTVYIGDWVSGGSNKPGSTNYGNYIEKLGGFFTNRSDDTSTILKGYKQGNLTVDITADGSGEFAGGVVLGGELAAPYANLNFKGGRTGKVLGIYKGLNTDNGASPEISLNNDGSAEFANTVTSGSTTRRGQFLGTCPDTVTANSADAFVANYDGITVASIKYDGSAEFAGNVGIGEDSPFTTLHVLNDGTGTDVATSGTTDTTTAARIGRDSIGIDIGVLNNGTSYLQNRSVTDFATNYNFVINPNGGNVGIGNSDPDEALTIGSFTGPTQLIRMRTSSSQVMGLDMGDSSDPDAGRMRYYLSDSSLRFHTESDQRLRIDSDGLKFGDDSAASNALDDYEEGTWTPSFTNGTFTYSTQTGTYTKVGNIVNASIFISWSAVSGSGAMGVNLPFTAFGNTTTHRFIGAIGYNKGVPRSADSELVSTNTGSSSTLNFYGVNSAGAISTYGVQSLASSGELQVTITYQAA